MQRLKSFTPTADRVRSALRAQQRRQPPLAVKCAINGDRCAKHSQKTIKSSSWASEASSKPVNFGTSAPTETTHKQRLRSLARKTPGFPPPQRGLNQSVRLYSPRPRPYSRLEAKQVSVMKHQQKDIKFLDEMLGISLQHANNLEDTCKEQHTLMLTLLKNVEELSVSWHALVRRLPVEKLIRMRRSLRNGNKGKLNNYEEVLRYFETHPVPIMVFVFFCECAMVWAMVIVYDTLKAHFKGKSESIGTQGARNTSTQDDFTLPTLYNPSIHSWLTKLFGNFLYSNSNVYEIRTWTWNAL